MSNTDPRIESLRAEIARLLRIHQTADAAQRYLELRAIDPTQVLPSQEQVDVASQLMALKHYPEAAAAFEAYLRVFPTGGAGQQDQITLMLGLIYARYLPTPAHKTRARELLQAILPKLHNPAEKDLAQAELTQLGAAPPTP
jgi:outer membrane protein assembly factor BamD (BamD/ComL family)